MRVMCYERYPRFHTSWGPERWSDQLSISQHPCSWLPPARESHRQPDRGIWRERVRERERERERRGEPRRMKRASQLVEQNLFESTGIFIAYTYCICA